jgi:hypothetical protein
MKTKKKRPTQWLSGNTNTKIQKKSYQKSFVIKELERVNNLGRLIDQRKIITDIAGRTLSIGQKKYQYAVEQASGQYLIGRGFEDFFQWYNKNFGSDE